MEKDKKIKRENIFIKTEMNMMVNVKKTKRMEKENIFIKKHKIFFWKNDKKKQKKKYIFRKKSVKGKWKNKYNKYNIND